MNLLSTRVAKLSVVQCKDDEALRGGIGSALCAMSSPLCECLARAPVNDGNLTSLYGGDLIFSIDGVLGAEEASRLVAFGESAGFVTQLHEADEVVTYRHNDRLAIVDESFAAALWTRLCRHMPRVLGMEPVGCSSNIRLYKYSKGMRFGRHVDGSHADSRGNLSQYTVLIYLNDSSHCALRGGATAFYAGQYSDADVEKSQVLCFEPRRGTALLHGHGERCLLHEGCEVTNGIKYVLRTDIMYA